MLKPVFKDGVPTCPCGSQKFNVGFKELIYHELDANKGIDGWGESDSINLHNPIMAIMCLGCNEQIEVTPEMKQFIRAIEGIRLA